MSKYSTVQELSLHHRILEGVNKQDLIVKSASSVIKLLGLNPKSIEHVISEDGEDQLIFPITSNILGISSNTMSKLVSNNKFIGLMIEDGYITILVKSELK